MPGKVKYLLSILEKKNIHTFSAYLLLSIISPALDIFSFSVLLHILNRMLTDTQSGPFMIGLCACLAAVCAGKGLLDLYKARVTNRFLYESMQTLSFRFFDLFLHEELLEHYKKSPLHAVEIIRADTLKSIQIIICGSTYLSDRAAGLFQHNTAGPLDVAALPDNARTH